MLELEIGKGLRFPDFFFLKLTRTKIRNGKLTSFRLPISGLNSESEQLV